MEMMLQYLMYAIGIALGAVCFFVVKEYLIPLLKLKLGNERYDELVKSIKDFMVIAEEHFGPKTGEEKKQWVIDQLKKLGLEFDEELVSNLIDGFTLVMTAQGVLNRDK